MIFYGYEYIDGEQYACFYDPVNDYHFKIKE